MFTTKFFIFDFTRIVPVVEKQVEKSEDSIFI